MHRVIANVRTNIDELRATITSDAFYEICELLRLEIVIESNLSIHVVVVVDQKASRARAHDGEPVGPGDPCKAFAEAWNEPLQHRNSALHWVEIAHWHSFGRCG